MLRSSYQIVILARYQPNFTPPTSAYLSEYVCQIWLRSDGRVEKRGVQTDRQTDKGTLQLYIVDEANRTQQKQ